MTTKEIQTGGLLFFISGLFYIGASAFSGNRVLYAVLGVCATVLLAFSIRAIGAFMREDAEKKALQYGVGAMLVGVPFLLVVYGTAYAKAVTGISESTSNILGLITILVGGFLAYGVSPALIAYSGLKHSLVPRWLSWVGLISGLYGLGWAGWVWAIPPAKIVVLLPGVLLTYIWQLGMGVLLMRRRNS